MDDTTRRAARSLIGAREELVFHTLKQDPEYQELCQQQEESGEAVEILLQKLEKDERRAIHSYYDGEIHKTGYQITGAYLQGLRDCFHLIGFLNGNEVRI
ncbi:MAG: hypothetical protein LBS36_08340 [Oscillospiraceae bacterium]|nr:hypothetical protein [Oscillospiraceae bacterium]